MLRSKNFDDKTYEEYIAEAIARIPLYSREWTNYNPSDPGITILENFSAFAALQRSSINEVPEKVRWQLLKLAGFMPQRGNPAKVYLRKLGGVKWRKEILPGEKIYAQDICFEFAQERGMTDVNLTSVCSRIQGKTTDISELLEEYGVPEGIEIFGTNPSGGEELHFYFDELPCEEELTFAVEVREEFVRNPFRSGDTNPFATVRWSILTEDGMREVMVSDETQQFLVSGMIQVKLPPEREKICKNPENGMYEMVASIVNCAYDLVPKVISIRGMLSIVEQKDTASAICFYEKTEQTVVISHELLKSGYFEVYEKQQNGYRLLLQEEYIYQRESETSFRLSFASGQRMQLMVVILQEMIMPYRKLGQVYGFDNQEIELPILKRVYAKEFSLLVKQEETYFVIEPENMTEDMLLYQVQEETGKLVIKDCGVFEDAELYLGNYCTYAGEDGNVIPGTRFIREEGDKVFQAFSCGTAILGKYEESLEQVRQRFSKDIRTPATIVTREDCEQIVQSIPGLAIHKVRAEVNAAQNEIRIAIKPYSRELYPKLSPVYIRAAEKYLAEKRLLSSKIVICQPRYVPIRVNASLHLKKNCSNGIAQVKEVLDVLLDGTGNDRNFGETIYFHKIYQALSALDCVEEIIALTVAPQTSGASFSKGLDIFLEPDALSCPGEYQIETGGQSRMQK